MSIADYNSGIWFDPNQTHSYLGTRPTFQRDNLLWDMQSLADTYFPPGLGAYATVYPYATQWCPILLNKYDDGGSGDGYIQRVDGPYAVTSVTSFNPDALIHKVSAGTHPLLQSTGAGDFGLSTPLYGVQDAAELALFEACTVPGSPYLMATTTPNYNLFGPLFFESISFRAAGSNGLTPVSVDFRLSGGRTILSPAMSANIWSDATAAPEYRTATFQDCGIAFVSLFDTADLATAMANGAAGPIDRLVEFSLSITQSVKLDPTANGPERSDFQGPRYASISNRVVSGAIHYYSLTNEFIVPQGLVYEGGSLTLYFGGPFLFTMENVDFQRPIVTVSPGKGYVHIIKFIARNAPGAITRAAQGLPAAEFSFS